jgi:hypothetical protein
MIINVGDVVVVNGNKERIDAYPEGMNFGMVIAIKLWRGQEHFILKNPIGIDGSNVGFCYRRDITAIAFRRLYDDAFDSFDGVDWDKWLENVHGDKED